MIRTGFAVCACALSFLLPTIAQAATDNVTVAVGNADYTDGSGGSGTGYGSASATATYKGQSVSISLSGHSVTVTSSDGTVSISHTIPASANHYSGSATLANGFQASWGATLGEDPPADPAPTPAPTQKTIGLHVYMLGTNVNGATMPYIYFTQTDAGEIIFSQNGQPSSYGDILRVMNVGPGRTIRFKAIWSTFFFGVQPEFTGTIVTESTTQYPFAFTVTLNIDKVPPEILPQYQYNACVQVGENWAKLTPIANVDVHAWSGGVRWNDPKSYLAMYLSAGKPDYSDTEVRTLEPECGDTNNQNLVYYVRKTGADTNDGKAKDRAFLTVAKAAAVAGPGSTVYIGAGTYQENVSFTKVGTSAAPIRFLGDRTGAATGDSGTVLLQGTTTVSTGEYLRLQDMTLSGTGNFVKWQAKEGTLAGCEITGGNNAISVTGTGSLLVENCSLHDIGDDGLDISTSGWVVVRQCQITRCQDDGIDVEGYARVVVDQCQIFGNASDGVDMTSSAYVSSSSGFDLEKFSYLLVDRSRILNNAASGLNIRAGRAQCRNSLIGGNKEHGIYLGKSETTRGAWMTFEQSTLVNNRNHGMFVNRGIASLRNCIVANNGAYGVQGLDAQSSLNVNGESNSAYVVFYNNRSGSRGTLCQAVANTVWEEDPEFVSPANGYDIGPAANYRLGEGSLAKDAAGPTDYSSFDNARLRPYFSLLDLDGSNRVQGSKMDLGALEGAVPVDRTLYVALTGNDANDGSSWERALRTLNKAAELAGIGTRVNIRAGTYTEMVTLSRSGVADRPVRFIAETPGQVVISPPVAIATPVLLLNQIKHVKFEGLVFSGAGLTPSAGPSVTGGTGITFSNCQWKQFSDTALRFVDCVTASVTGGQMENSGVGLYGSGSGLTLDGTKFLRCTSAAMVSDRSLSFVAKNCSANECGQAIKVIARSATAPDAALAGTAPQFEQCTFNRNGTALCVERIYDPSEVQFKTTTFTNTLSRSLDMIWCKLDLTSTWNTTWPVDKAAVGMAATGGTLKLSALTLANYSSCAVFTTGVATTLSGVKFQNNGVGLYVLDSTALSATNCEWTGHNVDPISNPLSSAVILKGKGTFSGCKIDQNQCGMYLVQAANGDVVLSNTTVTRSTYRALHLFRCNLAVDATFFSPFDITGSQFGVYVTGGKLDVRNTTFRGARGWGMYVTGFADFVADTCVFDNNGQATDTVNNQLVRYGGLNGVSNMAFKVNNCTFTNNSKGYGLATNKFTSISGCTMTGNAVGLGLSSCNQSSVTLTNNTIKTNDVGLYADNCQLTLNEANFATSQPTENNYNLYLNLGKMVLDKINLTKGAVENLTAIGSDLTVSSSKFTAGGVGLTAWGCTVLKVTGCEFTSNSFLGAKICGPATLKDCKIENNNNPTGTGGGLLLCYTLDSLVDLTGTTIKGHNGGNGYGVGVYESNWTIDGSNLAKWSFKENTHALHFTHNSTLVLKDAEVRDFNNRVGLSYQSNITIQNVKFVNNGGGWTTWGDTKFAVDGCTFDTCTSTYGILAGYTPVTVANTTFKGNAATGLHAQYNQTLDVTNCTFTGNKSWALATYANSPATAADDANLHKIVGCTISGNTYGLRIAQAKNENILLKDTLITGNGWYSLMYDSCNLVVNDQATNNWQVKNNTNGPAVLYGNVRLEGVVSEGNSTFGFFTEGGGTVALVGCRSSGSKHGYFQNQATAATLDRCQLIGQSADNFGYGIYLEGGPVDVRNCVFANFHQAVLSQVLRGTVPTRTIVNNTFAGLRFWSMAVNVSKGDVIFRNNILTGNGYKSTAFGCASGTLTATHNLVDGFTTLYSGVTADATNIVAKPRFVDPSHMDFQLASGSPAINAGTDLSSINTTDFAGNARPGFRVFDIGAYELTGDGASLRVLNWDESR